MGTYVIQITAEGYMPHSIRLVVEENKKTQTQPIHLIQQESNWVAENQTVLATGGSVISALFLSLSVWHYLSARDTADQATTLIQQVDTSLSPAKRPAFEQNIQRLESESDTAQSTSLIFLGTSVLFAAASTWLWTHDFKTQPTTKHTLQSRKKSRSRYSINALVDQRDRQNYSSSQKLKNTQSTPQLFVTPLSVQFQLSF